jgi:hypothetical protein
MHYKRTGIFLVLLYSSVLRNIIELNSSVPKSWSVFGTEEYSPLYSSVTDESGEYQIFVSPCLLPPRAHDANNLLSP